MVVFGLYSAPFICTSVIIALLLDRGLCDAGNKFQFATSSPWFPSGPPPFKPPSDNATSEALQKILPLVTFDCKGKTGYFPDSKFHCEVFHYCKPDGDRNSFHCPPNSLFNQLSMVCEEKSPFNTRICKEGSINAKNPKNTRPKQAPKKKYVTPHSSKYNLAKPAVSFNSSKTNPGYVVTLEDLLGYMNNDYQKELTVSSGFYATKGVHSHSDTLVKLPTPTGKLVKNERKFGKTSTTIGPSTRMSIDTSPKTFSKLVNTTIYTPVHKDSEKPKENEDVFIERDAMEGRKKRKHLRVGRVLDIADGPQIEIKGKRQTHSHVSARSPTESPPEDFTRVSSETTTASNSSLNAPRLFTADRSKAKDFRKRRRNLNRRKKVSKDNETTTVATLSEGTSTQSAQEFGSSTSDHNGYKSHRAEKEDKDLEMSQSWLGFSKSGKVEPYTLPPLPKEESEPWETTTQFSEKEDTMLMPKRKRTEKSGRTKNQWYKTTPIPGDEFLGSSFGGKLADSDHNPGTTKSKEQLEDELEVHSSTSEENKQESTKVPNYKQKYKNENKYRNNEERFFRFPLPSINRERLEKSPEDFFPPPRAEPRELSTARQVSSLYESSIDKPTTESPYKSTHSFMVRPNTRVKEPNKEGLHWTLSGDKRKSRRKKLQVGSTFSSHGASSELTPTTESPITDSSFKKELPKITTEAHQQLLKLMNDFFALSTNPKDPTERATEHYKSIEDYMATPYYKTSEEDVMAGAETITEDVEELPSELLDVVDFIAGQSKEDDEKEPEPDTSHEVIKISGHITNEHLKEIFSNDEYNFPKRHKKTRKESIKKIVVLPPEEKENYKDISEIAKFASLKLKPMYKQISLERPSMTVIPLNTEVPRKKPTVMSAKKIPVRVVYKDQISEQTSPRIVKQPNLKVIRSHIPKPTFQVIQNGKMKPTMSNIQPHRKPHPQPKHQTQVVIQPKSIYPPHPAPLNKNVAPFKFGFPFGGGVHPMMSHMQYAFRRKRSALNRDRRQVRPNPSFLPFPRQIFPGFNPKFVPTFSPFKNIFSHSGLHTSGSSVSPFAFPRPPYVSPPMFKPSDSQPGPVRHVTQAGHQTVIVEEVPVPIHVEVSDPNMLRPVHPGNLQKNLINPFPSNQFRSPSPPAITTPPLVHSFQGRFPGNPNYRPLGMPSNVGPHVINYRPSLPFSPPLPPSITNQGQVYALGVTNKPFGMKPPPVRVTNSILDVPGKPARPFQHFDVHANAYPNFPYFQGAFTTPLSDDSVPGRIMYSGYKPPKTTAGAPLPRTTSMPNRDREHLRSSKTPPRSKPTQSYFHVTKRPTTEYFSYNTPSARNRNPPHQNSPTVTEFRSIRPNFSIEPTPPIENTAPKRRRPYRKRRPRPHTSTTPTLQVTNDISPTPPPPEQIPPPPAEYTSVPLNHDYPNSLQNSKAVSTNIETSSLYPPAGYYGKDQLGQFFDSSAKSYKKTSTSKPYEQNDLGESTSSAELDESITSISIEDSDQPAFGTRLRGKSQSPRRKKKNRQEIQSPTQRTEVRVRSTSSPDDISNKRDSDPSNRRPYRKQENNDHVSPQKRQRPQQYKPRNRSQPSQKPQVNSYRYDDSNGFYSVPSGLQGLVDPSQTSSSQGSNRGSTDMFGIPHPVIDTSIYSLRPQGAQGGFNSNFFSVPKEVAQQQQSSLHKMDIKQLPKSAREFFSNAEKESSAAYKNANSSEKKETEDTPSVADSPTEETRPERTPGVRKLRKPKRKIRYNPRVSDGKQTTEASTERSPNDQIKPSTPDREITTVLETTTAEPRPTYMPTTNLNTQNDIKEPVFKQRSPLLPKTLPDISKSLLNGKIDIKKLNATISTSVSVSGAIPQSNNQSEDSSNNKRVFSSQNGGLAVVRGNPNRKRRKQKGTLNDAFGSDNESSNKAKYEIAASVLDIIKATTETEKNGSGFYSNKYKEYSSTVSPLSDAWASPPVVDIEYKRKESK